MKKPIPVPVIVVTAFLAIGTLVLVFIKAGSGGDIPNKQTEIGSKAVPDYLKDKLSPEVQAQIEKDSKARGVYSPKADELGKKGGSQANPAAPNTR